MIFSPSAGDISAPRTAALIVAKTGEVAAPHCFPGGRHQGVTLPPPNYASIAGLMEAVLTCPHLVLHVVIGDGRYVSFLERGLIPS